ncbi:metallophosphoesterase [Gryllotalpicola sp.]|uniref:metallophosphoesterase n=1 Tax=Gryllotalpicola sp. TaxID=1932787 RepID=UPI0026355F89|nr:metallophosphoesterase [Gryllotalpicola sp.]
MSRPARAGATVALAGAVAFAYGSLVERRSFVLRELTMPVLPAGSPDIRVLHLSDLHMAPWQHDKQRWVRALAALEPDLVVTTGDNLGHRDGLAGLEAAYDGFRGVPGVYVWGSNDYTGPQLKNPLRYFAGPSRNDDPGEALDVAALGAYLDGLGWASLNNTATRMTIRGVEFEFFGVDDPHRGYDRLDLMDAGLRDGELRDGELTAEGGGRSAVEGSTTWRSDGDIVRIGVAHAPYRRILDAFVDRGADAIFAGHTHGGQVCVPGFGALVTNCDLPRAQAAGQSTWGFGGHSALLHVSAGLGTSIYAPVRFACPPEATLLTLTAG